MSKTADRLILVQEEPRGPSQLIEIPILTNGRTKIPIPDVQQLRSTQSVEVVTKVISLVTGDVLTNGPVGGNTTAPLAELQKMTLVLYCEGWEKATYIPLLFLNHMATPAGTIPYANHQSRFNNWSNIDWSKSFIQYSNGTVSANTPYVVMFDVQYIKLDGGGREISGPSN